MKKANPIHCEKCDNDDCFIKQYAYPEWWSFISHFKSVYQYKKGELIIEESSPVNGIFFIYQGKVKVHKKWEGQKSYIVRLANSGDILGHRGFGGDLYYPISATALETCRICFIDNSLFDQLLRTNHELTYQLLMFYAEELKTAERRMRNLAHMSVKNRIADALLMVKNAYGMNHNDKATLNLRMMRKDLASLAGTTYETVIRTLNNLSEEKLIAVNGKTIKLLDEQKLQSLRQPES